MEWFEVPVKGGGTVLVQAPAGTDERALRTMAAMQAQQTPTQSGLAGRDAEGNMVIDIVGQKPPPAPPALSNEDYWKQALAGQGEISAHDPTWRENLVSHGGRYGTDLNNAIDFIPGVGEVAGIADTGEAAKRGNWLEAAINAGATALGMIPGIGDALGSAAKSILLGSRKPIQSLDDVDWGYKPAYSGLTGPGFKGRIDPNGVGADYIPTRELTPRKTLTPEDLVREDANLMLTIGDRTRAGGELRSVNGIEFRNPVNMEGGPDFIRDHHDGVWAADATPTKQMAKVVKAAGDRPTYLMPMTMAGGAGDFSHMMADASLGQIDKMGGNARAVLDERIHDPSIKRSALFEDFNFGDRLSEDIRQELLDQTRWSGTRRAELWDHLDNKAVRDAGLDVGAARLAITEPDLAYVPTETIGYNIARLNDNVITNPARPHSTYNTQIGGEYAGGFEIPVPASIAFPDFYQMLGDRGSQRHRYARAIMMNDVTQRATQEWLDNVMPYWEKAKEEGRLLWGSPTQIGR